MYNGAGTDNSIKIGFYDQQNKYNVQSFVDQYVVKTTQDSNCLEPAVGSLSMPHSATFTDIDGDCMPDLFLTKTVGIDTVYELYSQRSINGQQMYCLIQTDSMS